jgi:hypothetical protein
VANNTIEKKQGAPVAALVILGLIAVGVAGFWYMERLSRQAQVQGPVLTPEAKAYVRYLKLSGVEMKATQTYLKQTVVEITGNIANNGSRALKSVEINCVFYDPWGQVVLRERVALVRSKDGGLTVGQARDFRLAFDSLPESWNNAMPQLVIAQIAFS